MNKLLNIEYRKGIRRNIVEYIYNILIKTKYSKKILAFMIKSLHFTFPFMTYFIYVFAPLAFTYVIFIILFGFMFLYIYLQGCFITHLEYKLNKKNFINIIDPYLIFFNYPLDKESRYWGTLMVVLAYFISVSPILYIRFIYQ